MKLNEMYQLVKDGEQSFIGQCVDCSDHVIIVAKIDGEHLCVEGGAMYSPPESWHCDEKYLFKCSDCFDKDRKFYPSTEVYSRVVGYMRPVSQWNDGKKAEFGQRKMFKIESCCG